MPCTQRGAGLITCNGFVITFAYVLFLIYNDSMKNALFIFISSLIFITSAYAEPVDLFDMPWEPHKGEMIALWSNPYGAIFYHMDEDVRLKTYYNGNLQPVPKGRIKAYMQEMPDIFIIKKRGHLTKRMVFDLQKKYFRTTKVGYALREIIKKHQVQQGMNKDEVVISIGSPHYKVKTEENVEKSEVWYYGNIYSSKIMAKLILDFKDDTLVQIKGDPYYIHRKSEPIEVVPIDKLLGEVFDKGKVIGSR